MKKNTIGSYMMFFLIQILTTTTFGMVNNFQAPIGSIMAKSKNPDTAMIKSETNVENSSHSPTREPLAKMLTVDGQLNLPPGFSGNLDATGWQLVSGENEPPRFKAGLPGDEKWSPGFGGPKGVNGSVSAITVDSSGAVYVGGTFFSAGSLPVRNIAKWDGIAWHTLGDGLDDSVRTLIWDAVHGRLYAGGQFKFICRNADCSAKEPSRGIAWWNPDGQGNWYPMGYGVNGVVTALAIDDAGYLYAGGQFSTICINPECSLGISANSVAKWNPNGPNAYQNWTVLTAPGGTGVNGVVYALAWWNAPWPVGSVLVVGGYLNNAGGLPMNNLTMWSPSNSTWSSFWSGVDSTVYALAIDPATNAILVGGDFDNICEIGAIPPACGNKTRVSNMAMAIGVSYWGGLNGGINGAVRSLSIDPYGRSLYIGGYLNGYCSDASCTSISPASYIARWDYATLPGSWSNLGSGTDSGIHAIAWNSKANLLYVGGGFQLAGNEPARGLATWNRSFWSGVGAGNGVSSLVYAIAADGNGRVYLGGDFQTIGNRVFNRLAVWNSRTCTWSNLGNGVNQSVSALALDSAGHLYAGGNFNFLCANEDCTGIGQRVNGIARWTPSGDTGTWDGVGQGFSFRINALALDQANNLYAGGEFNYLCLDTTCSTTSRVNHVAVWNGRSWSSLGNGLSGAVRSLAVDRDNNLYAGGDFWFSCGNEDCSTTEQRVNSIAKWMPGESGGKWSMVGNGLDKSVSALAVDHNNILYAGGYFNYLCSAQGCTENTQRVSGIAQWNGSWSPVGYGVRDNGIVYALAVDEMNHLYAGGHFQYLCGDADCYAVGGKVNHIARWDGHNWSDLGSGMGPSPGGYIRALALSRGNLWVGGYFGTAGDKVSANFAQYIYGRYIYLPMILR
jgi:trimeric autotransporter adhesin